MAKEANNMTTTHHQPTMRMSRRRYDALVSMACRGMDEIEHQMREGSDYWTADDLAAAGEALEILRRMWGHLSDLNVDVQPAAMQPSDGLIK